MCQASATLKLCTCSGKELKKADNSWSFHRFDKGKEEIVVGTMEGPSPIETSVYEANQALLAKRLNELDAFDIDLKPKAKDRLLLSFCHPSTKAQGTARYDYGFEYRANKWRAIDYNPFEWEWQHNYAKSGCLK